jgi:hypothetical protein
MHICAEWLDRNTGEWIMNIDCYKERIRNYPERIENLYFLWSVVTRSISKMSPYLATFPYTGKQHDAPIIKVL